MAWAKTSTSTSLALHFHLFDLVFDFDLSCNFSSSTASFTLMFDPTQITSSFAMLTYLSSSEAVDFFTTCIEFMKRDPHLSPEVTTFSEWIFLQLFETFFSVQIIGDSFGDIDEGLICSFDFNIFLLDLLISWMPIRMVLDWQLSECFFDLITVGFFIDFQ